LFDCAEMLPIWNYEKIKKTGDKRYLIKLDNYNKLPENGISKDELESTWDDISFELVEEFGISEQTRRLIDYQRQLLKFRWHYEIEGKKIFLNRIREVENKIKDIIDLKSGGQKFEKQVAILESFFKFPFDVFKMSVLRYFTYIELYDEQITELKQQRGGKNTTY